MIIIVNYILLFIFLVKFQVDCKSDLSGLDFNEPVDYDTACGEPFGGEFPWLVSIHKTVRTRFDTTKKFLCNGNIINKYTVLLPAHCVVSYTGNQENPINLSVDVGKTTFAGRTSKTREYRGRNLIVHPKYSSSSIHDDIAILKLADPIQFSSFVHPICLTNDLSKFNTNQSGIVPVWTYLKENNTEDVLVTAYLPITYNNSECLRRDPDYFAVLLNDRSFCAGAENEDYNLCRGSSGVSLTLIEETRTKFIWYLKGMLSVGKPNPDDPQTCAPGHLVFTDVFNFHNWIIENKNTE